jgi:hypothetical protein
VEGGDVTSRSSQFPFWDFFCCNLDLSEIAQRSVEFTKSTLNSLFGISFVVTEGYRARAAWGLGRSLNSLFGISFVVTET